MKIDWKRKLASRKFWALLAALATAILAGIVKDGVVQQVVGIITAVGACIAYIAAEATVDKSYNEKQSFEDQVKYSDDE
jgi:hypothetical protein